MREEFEKWAFDNHLTLTRNNRKPDEYAFAAQKAWIAFQYGAAWQASHAALPEIIEGELWRTVAYAICRGQGEEPEGLSEDGLGQKWQDYKVAARDAIVAIDKYKSAMATNSRAPDVDLWFEQLKDEHRVVFPNTHETRYDIYRAWFNQGVKAGRAALPEHSACFDGVRPSKYRMGLVHLYCDDLFMNPQEIQAEYQALKQETEEEIAEAKLNAPEYCAYLARMMALIEALMQPPTGKE